MFDRKHIIIDQNIRSGVPVIAGTRFTVAQFLAEMIDGRTVQQIADDFDLTYDMCKDAMDSLSTTLNKSFTVGQDP